MRLILWALVLLSVAAAQTPSATRFAKPVLLHRVEPEYPAEARAAGLQGSVALYLDVDAGGKPANVEVLHGLGFGLDEKAVEAVKLWQFQAGTRDGQPTVVGQSAEVDFHLDGAGPWRIVRAAYSVARNPKQPEELVKPVLMSYTAPDASACPAVGATVIAKFQIGEDGSPRGITPQFGNPAGEAAARAIELWRFQPGTANGQPREVNASIEFQCGRPSATALLSDIERVGNGVSPPVVLYKMEPDYTEEARKAKHQGTALLQLVVDVTGHARDIVVIRPLGMGLDQKAIEAVQAWRFKPGLRNDQPVNVTATVEINFRLL